MLLEANSERRVDEDCTDGPGLEVALLQPFVKMPKSPRKRLNVLVERRPCDTKTNGAPEAKQMTPVGCGQCRAPTENGGSSPGLAPGKRCEIGLKASKSEPRYQPR